jgi:predicted Fe-Mo cluster-binding NifX family protein
MKILFSTSGDDLSAVLEPRFGRSPRFLVYDLDSDSFELVENQESRDTTHGAGIQTAEKAARLGVAAVVTGHCGPKAFRVLSAAGITVFYTDAETVAEALALYRAGNLDAASSSDAKALWR